MSQTFNDYQKMQKQENVSLNGRLNEYHAYIPGNEFIEMMKITAENIFLERHIKREFIVDKYNKPALIQLYFYLIGAQDRCEMDINKGIYMMGPVGSGKSVIMKSFIKIQQYLTKKIINMVHSKEIVEMINEKGFDFFKTCNLYIDELGRENLEANSFGNKIKPITDIFALRYENFSITYATSNFKLSTLEGLDKDGKKVREGYGSYITTRMQEMFNIIELPGPNRRLESEGGTTE